MDSSKANLVLEKFDKKLGFGQTPPPLVGPKDQLFPFFFFDGSPKFSSCHINIVTCVYIIFKNVLFV